MKYAWKRKNGVLVLTGRYVAVWSKRTVTNYLFNNLIQSTFLLLLNCSHLFAVDMQREVCAFWFCFMACIRHFNSYWFLARNCCESGFFAKNRSVCVILLRDVALLCEPLKKWRIFIPCGHVEHTVITAGWICRLAFVARCPERTFFCFAEYKISFF